MEYFNQMDIEQYHTNKKGKWVDEQPQVQESLGFNVIEEEEHYDRRNA
jgi:hypothetical protein